MTSPTPSMTAPAAPNPALDGHLLRIIAGGTKRTTSHPPARAAQRRAERYRRFLDALGVAVYTTDSDGKITFFNAAAAEFWGRRPAVGEEWCGSLRLLFLDESPMRHDECPMAITLKEARPVRGGQAIAVRPDGSNVSFMAYPTPLFDDDGQLIGAVNVLVDITERHRAEQAIRAAADALEASNAVKDEFLGLVSHELRTPVTTIFGNARLLQARGAELDDETRASMIADIATDADRLHSIIENLLHLTRLGSGSRLDLEPQVLDRVVEHAVASFGARNPDRTVEVTSARPRAIVEGDETYITLLLENLLSNAVKYSPAGSPVEVDDHDGRRRGRGRGAGPRDRPRRRRRRAPVRTVLPGRAGQERRQRPRHRPGAVPAHRGRARRPDLGATARRRRRGGRVRAAGRGGRGRSRRRPSAAGLTEPSAVQSPVGQIGGLGGWLGSASQSARVGAKMSMTTAPSGPTLTWCGVSDGIRHVPPGPS